VDADDGPGVESMNGDADGKTAIIGRVGSPFKAHVTYNIGWATYRRSGGSAISFQPEFGDVEYEMFSSSWPPGLIGGPDDGIVHGTPFTAGTWEVWPAVRDKSGKKGYQGTGAWWTSYEEHKGKTWSQSNNPTLLVILPTSTGRELRLQCSFQGPTSKTAIFEVDYDNKQVRLIGINGKLAGVYSANIDSDVIGWNAMSTTDFRVQSAMLDRRSGLLTVHYEGNQSGTANCQKRSEAQKF
jgi:hypothetical protein